MKKIALISFALILKVNFISAQTSFYSTYQVKSAETKPTTSQPINYFSFPSSPKKTEPIIEERSYYNYEEKKPVQATRITGYYKEGYGENAVWKKMSLKVTVETDRFGRDNINVTEYKMDPADYWITLSYGIPSKTYGEIANDFSYQVFVASKQVYFNF